MTIHRKIVEARLADLGDTAAAYFSDIVDKLDADPRTERLPNLVFVVLRETLPFLPTFLPAGDFIDELFAFVNANRQRLNETIYDRAYVENPETLRGVTDLFVGAVLKTTFEKYARGEIEVARPKEYRFSSHYDERDEVEFPYSDLDDEG